MVENIYSFYSWGRNKYLLLSKNETKQLFLF